MRNIDIGGLGSGIFFLIVATVAGSTASGYEAGTAFRMGPGYFPLLLSILLGILSLAIIARSFFDKRSEIGPISFRGTACVLSALVGFGLFVKSLGFIASVGLVSLLGSSASRNTTIIQALVITLALTAACYLVFILGLGLAFR